MRIFFKLSFLAILFLISSCNEQRVVNLYTALDYEYSKPIIDLFQKETGIKVNVTFDTEATKTVGLINRLLAEKDNPQCDVFWNNEILRTIHLKHKDVLESYTPTSANGIPEKFRDADGYWTGFAARMRVIVYNKDVFKDNGAEVPKSVYDLTKPMWSAKAAIANPMVGTSATHSIVFRNLMGESAAGKFFDSLLANKIKILPGNSVVMKNCSDGLIDWGITDSDDVLSGIQAGKPIDFVIPDQDKDSSGTLLIPNTVSLIKGAPNPESAKILINYLVSEKTEMLLSKCPSGQIPLHENMISGSILPPLSKIKTIDANFEKIGKDANGNEAFLAALAKKF